MADTTNNNRTRKGSHNKRLKETLSLVEQQARLAKSDTDLVTAVALLDGFPEPIKFNNDFLNKACIAASLLAFLLAALFFNPVHDITSYGSAVTVAALVVAAVNYFWKRHRRGSLTSLSDMIHAKSSLFDYGLTEQPYHPEHKTVDMQRRFGTFRYGNYQNTIKRLVAGTHKGSEHSFTFEYFHYHYVNQRVETYSTTDSEGRTRTRTRTVYDHFDRYGFSLPFPYTRGIRISETMLNFFKSGWKTSSIDFNKKFSVQANVEMDAAKFLTPKILSEISKAGDALSCMDLNFTAARELCFSFDNGNTLSGHRHTGLETPTAFMKEIAEHNNLKALDAALEFLHRLMKYSDNNFR